MISRPTSTAELQEDKEITKIVYNYYCEHYKNSQQAFDEFKKLNTFMKHNPFTTKFVKFGNIVFLLKLEGSEVEFHSLGKESSMFAYFKDLRQLRDYVKGLNVTAMYSYSNDRTFELMFRRDNLNFTKDRRVAPDGVTYSYYRLEF